MFCDSCVTPPATVAPPLWVSDVTLLAVQAPTPFRGVDSEPLIVVLTPTSVRFPFVPTLPVWFAVAGLPATSASVEL